MDWQQRQEMYLEHLTAEGYRPSVSDGHVHFKHEGGSYYLVQTDDPQFVQLLYPGFWPVEDPVELEHCLRAAGHANRSTKVATVMPYRELDNMMVSAEIFVTEPRQALDHLARLVDTIRTAIDHFASEMRTLSS